MTTCSDKGEPSGVAAFCDAVTSLSCANAMTRAWWYTWLSARDRFNSHVFDAYIAACNCTQRQNARDGWLVGVIRVAKEFAAALEGLLFAWLNPTRQKQRANVIVIAPATDQSLSPQNKPYSDPYFGSLLDWLRRQGESPLLIGLPQGNRRKAIAALARRRDIPAAAIHHFLGPGDILWAIARTALTRFRLPGLDLPGGKNAQSVISADLAAARGDVLFGLLVERAIHHALTVNPKARIIHTYENNPWERAVALAASDQHPPRQVTGYLHCAVLPSHLKNYRAPSEQGIRPAPSRIVCTGPAARTIFLSLGAHDPTEVIAGCGLRDPDRFELLARTAPPQRVEKILVLLEALQTMTELLRFLKAAEGNIPGRRILLRPHPMMPLTSLLPKAGIRLDVGIFEESRPTNLVDALEETDVVIYQSSTAAFTALAMGVPLIKASLSLPLDDDPLLGCDALKRVIKSPEELATAIREFEAMPQTTFLTEQNRARDYLERYLAKPDDTTLRPFLPDDALVQTDSR